MKNQSIKVLEVFGNFAKKRGYLPGSDFETYLSPSTIVYQTSDNGEFEPAPSSGVGQSVDEYDAMIYSLWLESQPSFDFDLSEFFTFALGAGWVIDFDHCTREGGLVALPCNLPILKPWECSFIGVKYVSFEEAFHTFENYHFEQFLIEKLWNTNQENPSKLKTESSSKPN